MRGPRDRIVEKSRFKRDLEVTTKIFGIRFERTAWRCYNSEVPHVSAHRLFCFAASRPVRAQVHDREQVVAPTDVREKWPGSSGGRAQP